MNDAWILHSKLVTPTPPAGFLRRDFRATSRGLPPATVLLAGPGYGKTLGLLALSQQAHASGALTVWYSLDAVDADVATFFYHLVAGMRRHIPQFGRELDALLAREALAPRVLWQRFFDLVAGYNLPGLCLVLDDCHHIADGAPALLEALAYFLDKLPPRVHVLLASRKRLPVALGKLHANGTVAMLDQMQMRFDASEEAEFLRHRAAGGHVPDAWREQAARLDGWPLGLALIASDLGLSEPDWALASPGDGRLADYVAEEFFGAQPPSRQAFMLRSALLQTLTPDVCRTVFLIPDSLDHIRALEGSLLLQRLAQGSGYRYPTYLRDFLLAEGERSVAPEERADWHRRAATFYSASDQPEHAIPHLLASGDWDGAVKACQASFPVMAVTGRHAMIRRLVASFPAARRDAEPLLQLWWGQTLTHAGQHAEARGHFERARALFEARGDAPGGLKALVRECTLALYQEDLPRFDRLLTEAQVHIVDGRPEDLADLLLARAFAGEQRADPQAMQACNEAVLEIPIGDNLEVASCHCIALMNLYTLALHQGDHARAHRCVAQAIEIARSWDLHPLRTFAAFLLLHLRLAEGDIEAADSILRGLPPHWRDLLDWRDLGCAYATLGYYHETRGDWKEAEEALNRSRALFEQAGFKEGEKVPIERLLWLAVHRKQYARTAVLLQEAGAVGQTTIHDLALWVPRARAMHLDGDAEAALAVLATAIPAFQRLGAQSQLAKSRLYEAAAHRRLGRPAEAAASLAQASAIIQARNLEFLLRHDQPLWEELADMTPEGAVGESPDAEAAGGLRIRCYGGLDVLRDGVVLDQWPRRGAKLVLAALLLHPRGLGVAGLIELLGGGEADAKAVQVMQMNISALRRVLEPGLAKGATSAYVRLQDDRYVLAWDRVAYFDVRAAEQALAQARGLAAASPQEAAVRYEEAIAHYRGHLLDERFFSGLFEPERQARLAEVRDALLWLGRHHAAAGDLSRAEAALKRAIALAPCDEEPYVSLMRLYHQGGLPERIRPLYWDHRKALKAFLDADPSEGFEAAYQLLTGPDGHIAPAVVKRS